MIKRTHYPAPPERTIIGGLTPQLRLWLADTVAEPVPEDMIAIIRQMDTELPARPDRLPRRQKERGAPKSLKTYYPASGSCSQCLRSLNFGLSF